MTTKYIGILLAIFLLLQGCYAPGSHIPAEEPEPQPTETISETTWGTDPEPEPPLEDPQPDLSKRETLQVQGYEEQRQKLMDHLLQEDNVVVDQYPWPLVFDGEMGYPWLDTVLVWGEGTDEEALCLLYQIGFTSGRGGLVPWVLMMDSENAVSFAYAYTGPFCENFQLGDIDGDGQEEILTHINSGGNGTGHYYTRIYQWSGEALSVFYDSELRSGKITTSFTVDYYSGFTYRIRNTQTGLEKALLADGQNWYFDESGYLRKPQEAHQIICYENFEDFLLADLDGDGIQEIIIADYYSLCWLADSCFLLSVLRYDKDSDTFHEIRSDVWKLNGDWEARNHYIQTWYLDN